MRVLLVLLFGILFFKQAEAQTENVEKIQSEIANLIGELKKETPVNYMKYLNQFEGFKHGLWIESIKGQIEFVNYDLGLKDGKTTIYYTNGKKGC